MTMPQEHERTPDLQLSRRAFLATGSLALGAAALWPRSLEALAPVPRAQEPTEHHRFRLGDMRCIAVNDGRHQYTAAMFFANAPAADLAPYLARYRATPEAIPSPFTCLFVDSGAHRVLIDAGGGPALPGLGHLRAALHAEGVEPGSVDTVIITHGHPDHIGGLVGADGQPVFANAQHVIWQSEWDFWSDEANLAKEPPVFSQAVRHNLLPLRNRITCIDSDREVVPGVRAVAAPGHTPGHMVVALRSKGKTLFFAADAALHPIHLERPDWYPGFDTDRERAAASRRRIFDQAADEHALVVATHFEPFPSIGRVSHKGAGWAWEAIG